MGTSQSQIQNEDLFEGFNKKQWTRIKDQGLYELWQNTITSQLCQAYKLDYVPHEEDLQHYRFRHYNQNADSFVDIRYVDIEQNTSLCNHGLSYVLTEFIPVKLGDMHDLTQNEGYRILRDSYRAFHTMQAFYGHFVPNEDLIGINLKGKPKIWLNRDHSQNEASSATNSQISQNHSEQANQNVRRILEMVQEKLQGNGFPTDFRNYFHNNVITLSQASEFVEDYCEKHQIPFSNTIDYNRFVKDQHLAKIIHEYNTKRQSNRLNEKLNTMESTNQQERLLKQDQNKIIKRVDSHRLLGSNHNVQIVRNQSVFNPSPIQQSIILRPVQRPIFTPVVQRTMNAQIPIPPRTQIIPNFQKESKVLSPQRVIPSKKNIRPMLSITQVQSIRQIQEPPKTVDYQNLKTPAHILGNIIVIPPNKITEFELPVRKQQDIFQIEKVDDAQKSESKNSESIHEKIKDFQNDSHGYLNESIPINGFAQQARQPQPQNQEFQKYINQNSEEQPQRSEDQQNITSEPDWEQIQNQNHHHVGEEIIQQNHHEEYTYQHQTYEVTLEEQKNLSPTEHNELYRQEEILQNRHDDISPIKENPVKNTQEFENHYAMFAKYAQSNQNQQQQDLNIQQDYTNQQDQVANSASFQPRNLDLNQSVAMSDQDPNNALTIQQEENQASANQPQQISALESSQNIHRNSSKNTSINRNGQSSGTLVVHESQENIYQEVSNEDRNYKVNQESIQQNSLESENQEPMDEDETRNQLMNKLLEEHNQQENQHEESPHWKHKHDNFDEVKQSNHSQNQEQQIADALKQPTQTNQYNNLHFRNESDELYQYTPVESVYRTESGKNWVPSFNRSSGVQDLNQLEKHQDIEEYIRNKYSGMISGHPLPNGKKETNQKSRSNKTYGNRAMTFAKPFDPQSSHEEVEIDTRNYDDHQQKRKGVQKVDSLYQKIDHFQSHVIHVPKHLFENQQENHDFLDVGNLEKSLDQKYKNLAENDRIKVTSPKSGQNIKGSQTMSEEDGMNVAALEQRLLKFEERQSIEREKSQRKIEVQNDEPVFTQNNELNFNELDNIVELMDKKIQESQKKQQNKSSQEIKQNLKVSEFAQRETYKNRLQNADLQTSLKNIHKQQISVKNIPILAKDRASNTSNSITASKKDYSSRYLLDTEDYVLGKSSSSNDYGIVKESYAEKKQSKNYDSKKYDTVNPVTQMDSKYENYSSKNISSYDYNIPDLNAGSTSTKDIYKKCSRRSSKNIEEAKRLAEQISNKYDKYMSSDSSSNYEVQRPFAKKSYTNIVDSSYDNGSSRNIINSSKYINEDSRQVSGSSRVSARDIQRKRSSYLNPIEQLNCQNWASPLKESTPQQNPQNYLKLSNANSRAPSARNLEADKSRRNSKVSYDQLRDLLWK